VEDNSPDRNHLKSRRSCPLPKEVYVVIDTAATFAKTNSLVFYAVKRTGVLPASQNDSRRIYISTSSAF